MVENIAHDEKANEAYVGVIIRHIKTARKAAQKADECTKLVLDVIDDWVGEIDKTPTGAENADNLKDAISCYIQYGE